MNDLLREVSGLQAESERDLAFYSETTNFRPEGATGYCGCSGIVVPSFEEPVDDYDWLWDVEFGSIEITEDEFNDADYLMILVGDLESSHPVYRYLMNALNIIKYPNPEDFYLNSCMELLVWEGTPQDTYVISIDVESLIDILQNS